MEFYSDDAILPVERLTKSHETIDLASTRLSSVVADRDRGLSTKDSSGGLSASSFLESVPTADPKPANKKFYFLNRLSRSLKVGLPSNSLLKSSSATYTDGICSPTPVSRKFRLVKVKDYLQSNQTHYGNQNYTLLYKQACNTNSANPLMVRAQSQTSTQTYAPGNTAKPIFYLPCKFHPKITVKVQHFAHAMEQLYACIDYWIETKEQLESQLSKNWRSTAKIVPLLLYDQETQGPYWKKGLDNARSLMGIINILKTQIGLEQQTVQTFLNSQAEDVNYDPLNTISYTNETIPYFSDPHNGFLFRNVAKLNQIVQKHFEEKQKNSTEEKSEQSRNTGICPSFPPKIRILSRKYTRGIVNANQLARRLSLLEYDIIGTKKPTAATTNSTTVKQSPVSVHYFEGTWFVEQFRFLQSTDILISGHGAQLTGLPFMGSMNTSAADECRSCRQLLELFPRDYALPYYFGSLAVQSNISHSYVYLDDDDDVNILYPWQIRRGQAYRDRFYARNVKLCPNAEGIVEAVVELIQEYYACCCGHSI